MVMKNIIPFFIIIVFVPLLFSILWNNPRVKQAFTDIGTMMQLNTSDPIVVQQLLQPFVKQGFADIGSQIQIQGSNVYDTKIWKPIEPTPTTCFKQQNSVSDKSQFLNNSDVYNYYPQVQVQVS